MARTRVHVGQAALKGHLERYAKTFDLLEVRSDPAPPSPKSARKLRQQAPAGFAFSLVAPRALCDLVEAPNPALVAGVQTVAKELGARFVLIRTPAAVAPSARSRARLGRLVNELRGAAPSIAWEPRGIWTDEEIASTAAELDVVAVRDLAEQDPVPGDVVYTRLLALGRNTRIGSGAIERVSERLEGVAEAFVIVEGQGAVNVAKRLRGALAEEDLGDEDEDDADEDEGEGTGDEGGGEDRLGTTDDGAADPGDGDEEGFEDEDDEWDEEEDDDDERDEDEDE